MTITDSRRLTGPGLLLDRPGAALEIHLEEPERGRVVEAWRAAAHRMLDEVGWPQERLAVRLFPGGATLALTAPPDALYAATEINEWALQAALLQLRGDLPDFDTAIVRFRDSIRAERNPRLLSLRSAARDRGLTFLSDEDFVSAGSGRGSIRWPARALPAPDEVEWASVHDIPIVLVTGSNGKTTVVRLLAAMIEASGRTAGSTSTDEVRIGKRVLETGDYSGPGGARLLLRQRELDVAVLETARGGLLRRGLEVDRVDAAVITNIAHDHLGEFGIRTLAELAETKLLVARAVRPAGGVVLNADDAVLRGAQSIEVPIAWFSTDPAAPEAAGRLRESDRTAVLEEGELVLRSGGSRSVIAAVDEVPLTVHGSARHNIANALAAICAADILGVTPSQMAITLRRFGRSPDDNPGRGTVIELGGARLVLDFAHNPHGLSALIEMVAGLPARRKLLLVGQAGDREDDAIRDLARTAMAFHPDRVVVKELEEYLRGRSPGEVPDLLTGEFTRLGVPRQQISRPGSEMDGVRDALAWARPGDLLLLTVHQDRERVVALLDKLRTAGWQAGEPLP